MEQQQLTADITALVHEGIRTINHHLRPNVEHGAPRKKAPPENPAPIFNIPIISGNLFDGNNFAPVADVSVELLQGGKLVPMKDANWQNPFQIVHPIEGTFSFWPAPIPADELNVEKEFDYTIRVKSPGYEAMTHFFKVTVTSRIREVVSVALKKTVKVADLYLFPPGDEEQNW
jgi:competence protein ComFB